MQRDGSYHQKVASSYASQHTHPLPALASGKGHLRHVTLDDLVALRKERREIRHAEREGRSLIPRIECRIDVPDPNQQALSPHAAA